MYLYLAASVMVVEFYLTERAAEKQASMKLVAILDPFKEAQVQDADRKWTGIPGVGKAWKLLIKVHPVQKMSISLQPSQ